MTNSGFIVGFSYADRLRLATDARHQALKSYFDSELESLTSLMGPISEGPEWPAGAAWLATKHGENGCIISDGLSDPWVERQLGDIGLGLEVFIESPDVKISHKPLNALADTWLFPMMAEISHTIANYVKLSEKLLTGELVSLELNIDHIKDGRGRVGVLLSPTTAKLLLPGGEVSLVVTTLLTSAELHFLRGKGETGKCDLAEKLNVAGIIGLSLLHRPSVI